MAPEEDQGSGRRAVTSLVCLKGIKTPHRLLYATTPLREAVMILTDEYRLLAAPLELNQASPTARPTRAIPWSLLQVRPGQAAARGRGGGGLVTPAVEPA